MHFPVNLDKLIVKCLKLFIKPNFIRVIVHFSIVPNPLLEEVCLTVKANIFHEVKGILGVPNWGLTNLFKKTVRNVFDVFSHLLRVHTYEITWECVNDEPLFNLHSFFDNSVECLS